MRQVKFGQSDKHTIKGTAVKGFTINGFAVHTTVNTAFVLTTNIIDFVQIIVSCELKRNGRTITVFNDVLYPLAYESCFLDGNIDEFKENAHTPQVLVVQTAALFHTLLLSSQIELHDVIALTGDDELLFEISPTLAAPIATVSTANSWMEWDYFEGVGNPLSVPTLRAESIRPNESNANVSLGSNVIAAHFINKDKTGVTTANQVLSFMSLSSDKMARTDFYTELLAKRSNMFPSTALGQARDQSFKLFDLRERWDNRSPFDVRLHSANLRLQFIAANVTAAKNWVVIRGYENDNATLLQASDRNARHRDENAIQYNN